MDFVMFLLIVLAIFVGGFWSALLTSLIVGYNVIILLGAWRNRKVDPIEWKKCLLINGGMLLLVLLITIF